LSFGFYLTVCPASHTQIIIDQPVGKKKKGNEIGSSFFFMEILQQLILALKKRNFNRAGTETRPYLPKITDNRQIFTEFVEATRQLSVVAPKLVKISYSGKSQ
jgi:hypothetical protein